jgi:cobalamin biosynthesis protein CobD/CbiB
MAVAAGQLGVRLEKPGYYVLHTAGRPPTAADIAAAGRLVSRAMLVAAVLSLAASKGLRR